MLHSRATTVASVALGLVLAAGCQTAAPTTQPDPLAEWLHPDVPAPAQRAWPARQAAYDSGGASHLPLYFEDVANERYGCSVLNVAQPWVSTGIFCANVVMWPYNAWRTPPWERQAWDKHPKTPPPDCMHIERFDPLAALFEAGAAIGLVVLVP